MNEQNRCFAWNGAFAVLITKWMRRAHGIRSQLEGKYERDVANN